MLFRPLDACYTPAWPALAEKAKVKDPMFFLEQRFFQKHSVPGICVKRVELFGCRL